MHNSADVRAEIEEITKMVIELYKSPIVTEPITETMIPTDEVPNIWAVLVNEQAKQTKKERKEKRQ